MMLVPLLRGGSYDKSIWHSLPAANANVGKRSHHHSSWKERRFINCCPTLQPPALQHSDAANPKCIQIAVRSMQAKQHDTMAFREQSPLAIPSNEGSGRRNTAKRHPTHGYFKSTRVAHGPVNERPITVETEHKWLSNGLEGNSLDIYQDDGSDVGPRCLMDPIWIDPKPHCEADIDIAEAISTYNQGLIYHKAHEYEEAIVVYECVLNYIFELLRTFGAHEIPSTPLLELAMRAHTNLGAVAYMNFDDQEARANFDAALLFGRQLIRHGKQFNLSVACALSNWCRVHWMRGDIATCSLFACMQELLQLRSEILPWYHVDIAAGHFNLAAAYHAQNQGDEAINHLRMYLNIAAHHTQYKLNGIDPIPALIYVLLIRYEDKDDGVSQELTRGLRTLQDKRQEGSTSAEVASVLNFLGTLLFHCKEHDNALLFFEEELRIEQSMEERDRVSISVTCNNIGRTLQECGKLREAIIYYKKALSADFRDSVNFKEFLKETRHGRDPTLTNLFSTVWYNLGLIHDKLGSPSEAIHAFQISLNLRKLILGPTHPDIACLWYNIAILQMERDFLNDANASFQQALAIRALCSEHQLNDERVIHALQKLSSLQKSAGNLRGAIAAVEQIGALVQQTTVLHVMKRHKELSHVYYTLAELYHALDETENSFAMARAAVNAIEITTPLALQQNDTELSSSDLLATVEQWALSYLLMGSFLHEQSESQQAYVLLQRITHTMTQLCNNHLFNGSTLMALREVIELLGTPHSAPVA